MIIHKMAGSLLTIIASVGIGCSYSAGLEKHLQDLETLKKIYYMLQSEIRYNQIPFQAAFEKIGGKHDGYFKKWLQTLSEYLEKKEGENFWEIWVRSIDEVLKESYLQPRDIEELKEAGKTLLYMENIGLYIEHLEYQIKELRESYKTKKRICQTLGIMGGIFLVIILM